MNDLVPNHARLMRRIKSLAEITENDRPYTRRSFTETYRKGREWLAAEMSAAGLTVMTDAGGNLRGRLPGIKGNPPFLIGSHIDTVQNGGQYDGTLGVLAGLEVAQTLQEHGVTPQRDLIVVDFLAEEVSEFGISCIGSRAIAGQLSPEMLARTDQSGQTLAVAIADFGGDPSKLANQRALLDEHAGYLELHIEQGPALETANKTVGVVTGIVGISRFQIEVLGEARHAGTTPMDLRADALVAAGKIIYRVNRLASDLTQNEPLVATIGSISVEPNQGNVIPGKVEMMLEARAQHCAAITGFMEAVNQELSAIELELGTTCVIRQVSNAFATSTDPELTNLLRQLALKLNYEPLMLPSGAGHDAVYMARLGPMGMIFVPSEGGLSHNPSEYTASHHIQVGVKLLFSAVLQRIR